MGTGPSPSTAVTVILNDILYLHGHSSLYTQRSTPWSQWQYFEGSSHSLLYPSPTVPTPAKHIIAGIFWRNDLMNAIWPLKCAFCISSFHDWCIIPWPLDFHLIISRLNPDLFPWPWIALSYFPPYYPGYVTTNIVPPTNLKLWLKNSVLFPPVLWADQAVLLLVPPGYSQRTHH